MTSSGRRKLLRVKRMRTADAGFTIVETMVVLAVTGVLFVAIVGTISARQSKVQFNQAVNQIKGEIEQVVNQVQSGQYPSQNNPTCAPDGSGNLTFSGASVEQGTNINCMFLGKVLQFGNGYGSNPENYAVYTIAGTREATELSDSLATVVPSFTEIKPLVNGLTTAWAIDPPGPAGGNLGAVGFMTYFKSDATRQNTTSSQTVQIIPIVGSQLHSTSLATINDNLATSMPSDNRVQVACFRSGGTRQSARLSIGGDAGASAVSVDFFQNTDCSSEGAP